MTENDPVAAEFTACPDFELAPLTGADPRIFSEPADAADGFVLAMALAFNDLKSIMWLVEQLQKGNAPDKAVTPYNGQMQGMRSHTTRMVIAILHERLVAISVASADGSTESAAFKKALSLLGPSSLEAWSELVSSASQRESTDPFRKFLVRVRNNVASHYHDPKALIKGYRAHFVDGPRTPYNEYAYLSLGPRLEDTRFYFADAAASAFQKSLDPADEIFPAVNAASKRVNQALRGLVEAFVRVKQDMLADDAGRVTTP